MLSGADFIVFSDDWGRHPFSCQHIMRHFLPENRVLWVETVGMRRPALTWHDVGRSMEKLRSFLPSQPSRDKAAVPEHLEILSPPMLPFGNRPVRALNRIAVRQQVQARLRELNFRDPILITTLPNAAEFLGSLPIRAAVYYCVDDFTRWPGVNVALVQEMEQTLLAGVDLLVCSSPELARIKERPGLQSEILPHGVDYDHFARAGSGDSPCSRLPGLKGPVIGYFGLLGEWVDLELLQAVLREFPHATLLLVGTIVADIASLVVNGNVVCTGPVPYGDLPEVVSCMDVLILPYHTGGRGRTITPLKLREYLATGKPVVAADLPECHLFSEVMTVAGSHNEFLRGIRNALGEGMTRAEQRRRSVARETWRDRAEQLSHWLTLTLTGRAAA